LHGFGGDISQVGKEHARPDRATGGVAGVQEHLKLGRLQPMER